MATATIQTPVSALQEQSTIQTNGASHHQRRDLKTIVNYADQAAYLKMLAEEGGKLDLTKGPEVYYPKAPPGIPMEVTVEDIGGREKEFTLEKNGFMLAKQTTKVILTSEDLADNEKIRNEYYPEMQAWLKEVTGADRVMVYHHGTRYSTRELNLYRPREENPKRGIGAPAVFSAHLDQSYWAGCNVLHKWIPEDAEDLFHGRVVLVNAWRPIRTVYRHPFGIADASSVPHTDLCPRPYRSFSEIRETSAIKPNPNHRWCYKFKQQADEVLIFKGFDNHGTSRVCPHTAFKDAEFEDREARESIEIRAILLWPDHESVRKGAELPS